MFNRFAVHTAVATGGRLLAKWRLWGVAGWGKIPHSTTMRAPTCPPLLPPPHPTPPGGWRTFRDQGQVWFQTRTRFFRNRFLVSDFLFCFQKHIVWFQKFLLGFRNAFSFSETHWAISEFRGGRFPFGFGTQHPFRKTIVVFRNSVSVSEMFFRFQNPCAGFRILASCFRNVAVVYLRGGLRYQLGVCLGARFVAPFRVFNTPHREISGRGAPTPGHFGEGAAVPLGTRFWPTYHQARCF